MQQRTSGMTFEAYIILQTALISGESGKHPDKQLTQTHGPNIWNALHHLGSVTFIIQTLHALSNSTDSKETAEAYSCELWYLTGLKWLFYYVLAEPQIQFKPLRLCSHYWLFGFLIQYLGLTVHLASGEIWSVCSDSIANITYTSVTIETRQHNDKRLIHQLRVASVEKEDEALSFGLLMSIMAFHHNILHLHAYAVFKNTHRMRKKCAKCKFWLYLVRWY